MSRTKLPLSQERIAPFDLETFVHEAVTLNQRTLEAFTTPFPTGPDRGRSHDHCKPRPIEFTAAGEVEGELRWLLGATIDLSCPRALLAPYDSTEGGHGDDPASAFCWEVASRVDRDPDAARVCADLRQQEQDCRYREMAGLHTSSPGADDLRHGRRRVDAAAIEAALAVFVGLFRACGLITGARLATAGQLAPSCSRFTGCADGGQACRQLPWDEANRHELCHQVPAGAKRLELRCPCPEVRRQVLQATSQHDTPREPTVALLELESLPADSAQTAGPQQLCERLSLPTDPLPPLRLTWSHLTQGPQGERWGRCPKVPADLEAKVGSHIDHTAPHKTARVFGYLHHTTTHIAIELGVEWPVGPFTDPARVSAGSHCPTHRAKLAIPCRSQQVELAEALAEHLLDRGFHTARADAFAGPVARAIVRTEVCSMLTVGVEGRDGVQPFACGGLAIVRRGRRIPLDVQNHLQGLVDVPRPPRP